MFFIRFIIRVAGVLIIRRGWTSKKILDEERYAIIRGIG